MQKNINDDEESAQTVGEILRNARIKQGKTLHDVADVLCIRTAYIDAIENMDFKNIPEPPYGIGFIRSYAEYLGLNSERIISSYKQTFHGVTEQSEQVSEKNTNSSKPKWRHIFLGFLGLASIVYIWSAWPLYQEDATIDAFENSLEQSDIPQPLIVEENIAETPLQTAVENLAQENTQVEVSTDNVAEDTETIEKDKAAADTQAKKPVVKMVITGPSWVELKANGQIILSRTLQRGFQYVIEDIEKTVVTVGRYKNVKFYADGKEVKVVTAAHSRNVALKDFIKTGEQE